MDLDSNPKQRIESSEDVEMEPDPIMEQLEPETPMEVEQNSHLPSQKTSATSECHRSYDPRKIGVQYTRKESPVSLDENYIEEDYEDKGKSSETKTVIQLSIGNNINILTECRKSTSSKMTKLFNLEVGLLVNNIIISKDPRLTRLT